MGLQGDWRVRDGKARIGIDVEIILVADRILFRGIGRADLDRRRANRCGEAEIGLEEVGVEAVDPGIDIINHAAVELHAAGDLRPVAGIKVDLHMRAAEIAETGERGRPGADVEARGVVEVDRSLDRRFLIRQRNPAEAILGNPGDPAGDREGRRRRSVLGERRGGGNKQSEGECEMAKRQHRKSPGSSRQPALRCSRRSPRVREARTLLTTD